MKRNYSELLRDPRWQKRRLEILNRDNFTCCKCCAGVNDGIPLNVHHRYYISGRAPWDYPDWCYQTMCEQCHAGAHVTDGFKVWEEFTGLFMPVAGMDFIFWDVINFARYMAIMAKPDGRPMLPERVRISMLLAALWEWWRREMGEESMPMCAAKMLEPIWKAVPEYWEEEKQRRSDSLQKKGGPSADTDPKA
jgi:hypothetical protein